MNETVSSFEICDFPEGLSKRLPRQDWTAVSFLGNLDLLQNRMLGLLCSMRCPGEIILKTYDLARALRDAKTTVIGGFHAPMEHECFEILIRGTQPIVVCPARSLESMRVPAAWRALLEQNRLLVISPFSGKTPPPDDGTRPPAQRLRRRPCRRTSRPSCQPRRQDRGALLAGARSKKERAIAGGVAPRGIARTRRPRRYDRELGGPLARWLRVSSRRFGPQFQVTSESRPGNERG